MSRTSDPPNDPMARLDSPRCDTRLIDVDAMRAIHAAFVTGAQQRASSATDAPTAAANDTTPHSNQGEAATHDTVVDLVPPVQADAARDATAEDAPTSAPTSSRTLSRDATPAEDVPTHAEQRPAAPETSRSAEPPAEAPQLPTVEVDYSPAARARRSRSANVQRAARAVTAACLVLALGVGLWALSRSGGDGARPSSSLPAALSLPPAAAPATAEQSMSSASPIPPASTIPTPEPPEPGLPPRPSRTSPPAPRPRATGEAPAGPGSSAAPAPQPSAAPSDSVPPPPGGPATFPILD